MEVDPMPEINVWLPSTTYDASQLLGHSSINYIAVTPTSIKDPDLLGNVEKSFNHFVQTGQVWALLIGLVLGYMFRSMTSYG